MADGLRAVVFDLFGTLISTDPNDVLATRRSLADDLGVDADGFARVRTEMREEAETGRTGGPEETLAFFAHRAGGEPGPSAIERAAQRWLDANRRWLTPERSTLDALDGLRAAGCRLGLLTNCSAAVAPAWADSPLAPRFDATAFSSEVGFLKPHPETYRVVCERLGLAPEQCLYVGDGGDNELTGAAAAGLHPVLLDSAAGARMAKLLVDHEAATWTGARIQELGQVAPLLATETPTA